MKEQQHSPAQGERVPFGWPPTNLWILDNTHSKHHKVSMILYPEKDWWADRSVEASLVEGRRLESAGGTNPIIKSRVYLWQLQGLSFKSIQSHSGKLHLEDGITILKSPQMRLGLLKKLSVATSSSTLVSLLRSSCAAKSDTLTPCWNLWLQMLRKINKQKNQDFYILLK